MKPTYGIKLVAVGGMSIEPPEWLVGYDPDGGDPEVSYPTGEVESSVDIRKARRFATFVEASECWKQQSTRTPLRPDFKPNRPLAAFTVQIEQLPEVTL